MRSTHDADEWTHVITRMKGYGAVSQPVKPQPMLDRSRAGTPEQYRKAAEYLATINLSAVDQWAYPLKTLPRPTGARPTPSSPNTTCRARPSSRMTSLLDKDGNVWYSDFGELFISKFDPKTLKLTEYPIKTFKPDAPVGNLEPRIRQGGQALVRHHVPGRASATSIRRPARSNIIRCRRNGTTIACSSTSSACATTSTARSGPRASAPRTFSASISQAANGNSFHPTDALPAGHHYGIYQVISDSKNNLWIAEFDDGHLGKIDAKTLQGDVVHDADAARPAAPHGDRRPGPHHGDRISRQQGRAVRPQDRRVHRI